MRNNLEWAVAWLNSRQEPPTPPNPNFPRWLLAHDNLHQFEFCNALGRFLPRQWGLCPRVLAGAQRRTRRGPSLGELTPAGADNSRGTLRTLRSDRPTMTALHLRRLESTPALASLPPLAIGRC
jgi:hypothetical protein